MGGEGPGAALAVDQQSLPLAFNIRSRSAKTVTRQDTAILRELTLDDVLLNLGDVVADVIDDVHVQVVRGGVEHLSEGLPGQEGHAAPVHPGEVCCCRHPGQVVLGGRPAIIRPAIIIQNNVVQSVELQGNRCGNGKSRQNSRGTGIAKLAGAR